MEEKGGKKLIRNHYYKGKMLDMENMTIEQEYGIHKNRQDHSSFFGSGIITGLGLTITKNGRIGVESGCCIDCMGRLLTVEDMVVYEPDMKKPDEGSVSHTDLFLVYRETVTDRRYSPLAEEKVCCDYIEESCELAAGVYTEREEAFERLFFEEAVLLKQQDIKVVLTFPKDISFDEEFAVVLHIVNLTGTKLIYSMQFSMETEGFSCRETRGALQYDITGGELRPGDNAFSFHLHRHIRKQPDSTVFFMKPGQFVFHYDAKRFYAEQPVEKLYQNRRKSVEQLLRESLGSLSLAQWERRHEREAGVYVGTVVYDKGTYKISPVSRERRRYAAVPVREQALGQMLRQYRGEAGRDALPREREEMFHVDFNREMAGRIRTGQIIVDIPSLYEESDILYSQPIRHGLGRGSVWVDLAVEGLLEEAVVYGDADLFRDRLTDHLPVISRWAVKLNVHNGTFQIALCLKEPVYQVAIRLRWTAVKTEGGMCNENQERL